MKEKGSHAKANFGKREQIFVALFLVFVGSAGRLALAKYPNLETVMVATFLIGLYVDKRVAFLFPLLIMTISDYLMGYPPFSLTGMSSIWIFTYSGFAFIYFLSKRHRGRIEKDLGKIGLKSAANAAGYGVVFALIYDLWTNLGAWWLMYPHTLNGFVLCYIMAVPFMLYHAVSGALTFVTFALPFVAVHKVISENKMLEEVEKPEDKGVLSF
ncbi:MAG TPA: hypothetical protein EYP29_02405 [Thermoplasmata archaeon]|nr:hypothetical protein [Thermoplasmata archaeon]